MALPFLSLTGNVKEAIKQLEGFRKIWDPNKKLFSHIWYEEIADFTCKDFWGVENG